MRNNTEKHYSHKFVYNPWVQGVVGSILLLSVFTELFGLHHGLFAIGLWHVAQLTPNLLQAAERILKWKKEGGDTEC